MSKTKTERAIKYSFNPFQGQWLGQRCRIIIESEPFAEGGMRTWYVCCCHTAETMVCVMHRVLYMIVLQVLHI